MLLQCYKTSCGQQEPMCSTARRNQLSHLKRGMRRTDHLPQLLDGVPKCSSSACGYQGMSPLLTPLVTPYWLHVVEGSLLWDTSQKHSENDAKSSLELLFGTTQNTWEDDILPHGNSLGDTSGSILMADRGAAFPQGQEPCPCPTQSRAVQQGQGCSRTLSGSFTATQK